MFSTVQVIGEGLSGKATSLSGFGVGEACRAFNAASSRESKSHDLDLED